MDLIPNDWTHFLKIETSQKWFLQHAHGKVVSLKKTFCEIKK